MYSEPSPSDRIKALPVDIGIEETRGQSVRREALRREAAKRARAENPGRVRRILRKLVLSRHPQ
jgi:hypothetical protein